MKERPIITRTQAAARAMNGHFITGQLYIHMMLLAHELHDAHVTAEQWNEASKVRDVIKDLDK